MARLPIALALLLASLGLATRVRAELSFSGVPVAHDVTSSRAALSERVARVIAYWSELERREFPRRLPSSRIFTQVAVAKLQRGREVAALNRALLDPRARSYGAYGTNITVIPGLCARAGDYDFMAEELVRLAYSQLARPRALWPETLRKIAWTLLPEAGARHHERFRLGLCGRHRDSENHILMTESSRYLTNQLRRRLGDTSARYDNRKNGFDAWMLRHLGRFTRKHFEEYNARPYQGYTVEALENLHSFAENPEVARAAELVLDYLSAVFAVQSSGLRRSAPFRRQARYADTPLTYDHDPETARFALLAGNYAYLGRFGGKVPYGEHFMLSAALARYRVPDTILDLIVDKARGPYYQRFRHDNVEIYASSPSFLLSAGGVFVRHFQYGSLEQHGWARPTTVMPTRDTSSDVRSFVRVEGSREPALRNNTCVAPGFACGLNVVIPAAIPAVCREQHGDLTLLDLTAPRCPLDLGFYVGARIRPCDSAVCASQADNFGALELREARELTFADFRARVLAHNRGRTLRSAGVSEYVSSGGRRFQFEVLAERTRWPIVAVDGASTQRAFSRWPLAEGDIVRAAGDGLVQVDNPFRGERLVLDARDPLRPTRRIEPLAAREK